MLCKVDFIPKGLVIARGFGTFALKQIALSVEKPVALSLAHLQKTPVLIYL